MTGHQSIPPPNNSPDSTSDANLGYGLNATNDVVLFDRHNARAINGRGVPMTADHFCLASETWVESFDDRYLNQERDEDSWMWNAGGRQSGPFIDRVDLQIMALIAHNRIEGILFVLRNPQPSRIETSRQLLYVTYVATAPWNRPTRHRAGLLRGVGTSLMNFAIQASHQAGGGGYIALHSLRSSDDFYHSLGFRNLGIDAAHFGMNYFELVDPQITSIAIIKKQSAVTACPVAGTRVQSRR